MKLKRKQRNWLIAACVLVMAGIVAFILLTRENSTIEQNYHIKNVKTITKVIIDDKDERTLTLEKKNDSTWLVNGYAATK